MIPHVLYHVSFDPVKKLVPRIPVERAPGEDDITKRICLSEDIITAVRACPGGSQALHGLLKMKPLIYPLIHIYVCFTGENTGVRFIDPSELSGSYGVGDAESTREWWALDAPKIEHRMITVEWAKFGKGREWMGEPGRTLLDMNYDIVKEMPDNAPELVFKDFIVDKCGLRRFLFEADAMLNGFGKLVI